MRVKLVRYDLPNRPDWPIIEDTVPLGTIYEVYGYDRRFVLVNRDTDEVVPMEAYFLVGNNGRGWLPTVCFETVKEIEMFKPGKETGITLRES